MLSNRCLVHQQQIIALCTDPYCNNNNLLICSNTACIKLHSYSSNNILTIDRLNKLIDSRTASMIQVKQKLHEYFREVKQRIIHSLNKRQSYIQHIINIKQNHPTLTLINLGQFGKITSKDVKLLEEYLEIGSRHQLQNIKTIIVKSINRLQENIHQLEQTQPYSSIIIKQIQSNQIYNHIAPKYQSINSSIITNLQFQLLSEAIKQNSLSFKQWRLLYRASEHAFNMDKFHQYVDDVYPTLTIIQTKNQTKLACYLNCKLSSKIKQQWISDVTKLSFIYSIDRRQIYKLINDSKCYSKAAYSGREGPQIGLGCDLYIKNGCQKQAVSGSNLGGSYELPKGIAFGSIEGRSILAGQQLFIVQDFEVYRMI